MSDYLEFYNLPPRLDGLRVLDVGASTGYFSYEFERRGAAEVVAVELPKWASHDWTPRYRRELDRLGTRDEEKIDREVMRDGFSIVGEALGSTRVVRKWRSIYELHASELGTFDIVFCGSMLMHVRDPILGIHKLRECCASTGKLILSISTMSPQPTEAIARFVGEWNQCNWWQMSAKCLDSLLTCADFDAISHRAYYVQKDVTGAFQDPIYVCHATPRKTTAI